MLLSSRTCRPKHGSRKRTSRSPPGRQAKDQKPEEACPGPGAPGSTRARGRSLRPATEPEAKAERTGVDVSAEASMARLAAGARVTPGPRRRGGPARRQGFRCALLRSASSESDGKASDIFNKESDTIRLLHRELRNPGRGRVWTLRGR